MPFRISALLLCAAGTLAAQNDWPTFGRDAAGTRFSPLRDITPANVGTLERAWTFHMRAAASAAAPAEDGHEAPPPADPGGRGGRGRGGRGGRGGGNFTPTSGLTPLVIGGVMYVTTPYGRVAALEPETGKEVWNYQLPSDSPSARGLEYWPGDKQSPATLFFGSDNGKLYALNAKTGKLVPGFGNEGIVNMKTGALNGLENAYFGLSSPPIVYKNVLITGAHTQESPSIGAAGDTRGWDVHTGKLLWTFHSVPRPGEPFYETWGNDSAKNRSGANVWGMFTIDTERGIVYMPFGEPTSDYWGGDRPGNNLYGTSLVAADALTGKVKWYFQAVHHDTWDYDLAAPPVLFDITRNGRKIPALAQLSKMGLLFILNRVTGEPIYGVEERKVPVDDALPGDPPSPTQPFPVKPPPLARNSFSRAEITDITPEQQKFCTDLFDSVPGGLHSGPAFTHYSTKPSIIFPSSIGGGNWNPPSYDPSLGYLFVNTMDFGSLNVMVKSEDGTRYGRQSVGGNQRWWNPANNMPCNKGPWGRLFAINVNTGDIAWETPLGITESLPEDKQKTGRPNMGGSLATASGLVFIGASDDSRFRAFDSKTGKELWVTKIDAGAHASPITYKGKDGKQYVVITATGGGFLGDRTQGDSVIAFRLP